MGQYHHPVCIEAEEGLNAYDFDVGAKEGEIGFSRPSPVNAIVALVWARGSNMPADCSQSALSGRWAGKRGLVQATTPRTTTSLAGRGRHFHGSTMPWRRS